MECQEPIEIFLLSRDRPTFFIESLNSIIKASGGRYKIIISDNSETDDIYRIYQDKYADTPGLSYRRRIPTLEIYEHHKLIIEECCAEFAVFFHDDDVVHSNYFDEMINIIVSDELAVAVGCNALIIKNSHLTKKLFMLENEVKKIKSATHLAKNYFSLATKGFVPFPTYLYRVCMLKNIYPEYLDAGRFSDFAFLTKILDRGYFIWNPKPLINYRVHAGNGTNLSIALDYLMLLRFMVVRGIISRKSTLFWDFKFRYWIKRAKNKGIIFFLKDLITWRGYIVSKFILFRSYRLFFRALMLLKRRGFN